MNRSYSKIRHMQKSNILLERRVIKEQDEVGEGFLSRLFGGGKKEDEKDYSDEELDLPTKEMKISNNPNHQLHVDDKFFKFSISEFEKFMDFCIEKGIYDLFLNAADSRRYYPLLDDNVKFESDWREDFIDRDGVFQILFRDPNNSDTSRKKRDEIWYSRVDAYNAQAYYLGVYDEELKKYVND
jgi:hypothetical protein